MSNNFVNTSNNSVQNLQPTTTVGSTDGISKDPKQLAGATFLVAAAGALNKLDKEFTEVQKRETQVKQEIDTLKEEIKNAKGGKNSGQAIGYGFLVAAKLALYKLENEYSELQRLEAQITRQMYKLTYKLSKALGEETYGAMSSEADQLRTSAIGQFISGGAQIAIFGTQLGSNIYSDRQSAKLTKENESLQEVQNAYAEDAPREAPTSSTLQKDDLEKLGANSNEKAAQQRLDDLKKGNFDNKLEEKTKQTELDQRAAAKASDAEREKVRDNVGNKIKANEAKKGEIATRKNTHNTYTQLASGISQSFSQGGAQIEQSIQKNEQAVFEANKSATQSAQSMVNASDGFKAMDSFQQDALNVLKIIEAVEQSNRYQPAQ